MIIGYEGYSRDNSGIADRRRLIYWASHRGHTLVDSRDSRAEAIVLTSSCDFGYWLSRKRKEPIVLDVVDGLIGEQSWSKNLSRGYGYWVTRRSTNLLPMNYRKMLISLAQNCRRVICSSPEQVAEWATVGISATDILDIHEEVPNLLKSRTLKENNVQDLFWEGLPQTLDSIGVLDEFLETHLDKSCKLNLLTNLNGYKYMNRYMKFDLDKIIGKQLPNTVERVKLIQWSPVNLYNYAQKSIQGVIPIQTQKGYNHLKAENRLLIMWRLGLPVLASPLASYRRVMETAGVSGICRNKSEWNAKLSSMYSSRELREDYLGKAEDYLDKWHNLDDILSKWDSIFNVI